MILHLAQLGVAGDVGDAVPQGGEGRIDGLGSPSLLLVRADSQLVPLIRSYRAHSVAGEEYRLLQSTNSGDLELK